MQAGEKYVNRRLPLPRYWHQVFFQTATELIYLPLLFLPLDTLSVRDLPAAETSLRLTGGHVGFTTSFSPNITIFL